MQASSETISKFNGLLFELLKYKNSIVSSFKNQSEKFHSMKKVENQFMKFSLKGLFNSLPLQES